MSRYRVTESTSHDWLYGTTYHCTIYDRELDFEVNGQSSVDSSEAKEEAWDEYYRVKGDYEGDEDEEDDVDKENKIYADDRMFESFYKVVYEVSSSNLDFLSRITDINVLEIPDESFTRLPDGVVAGKQASVYQKRVNKRLGDLFNIIEVKTLKTEESLLKWVRFKCEETDSVPISDVIDFIHTFCRLNGKDRDGRHILTMSEIGRIKSLDYSFLRSWDSNSPFMVSFDLDKSSKTFEFVISPSMFT